MRLGSGVTVAVVYASGYSSDWTPSLGTFISSECGPKKKKKKKPKKNNKKKTIEEWAGKGWMKKGLEKEG